MSVKKMFGLTVLLGLSLVFGACAKKTTDNMPASATQVAVPEAAAPAAAPSGELAAERAQAQQEVGNMIFFAFDSSELSPESRTVLNAKADALKKFPMFNIVIAGNCDERGTSEYNLALGERRAKAAQEFLSQLGITDTRMTVVSYGKERPLVKGHNEAAWSKNRRDEFKIKD